MPQKTCWNESKKCFGLSKFGHQVRKKTPKRSGYDSLNGLQWRRPQDGSWPFEWSMQTVRMP
jgi:hypothetical protein